MKEAKKNRAQRPVDMTQEEMDALKRGKPEIITRIHKRILETSRAPKTKAVDKKQKSSPAKLNAGQLASIKKTGKIPRAIQARMTKEKQAAKTSEKYRHPDAEKPKAGMYFLFAYRNWMIKVGVKYIGLKEKIVSEFYLKSSNILEEKLTQKLTDNMSEQEAKKALQDVWVQLVKDNYDELKKLPF